MRKWVLTAITFVGLWTGTFGGNASAWAEQRAAGQAVQAKETELRRVYEQLKSGQAAPEQKEYTATDRPTVYLTFDDGPSQHTAEVLDLLASEGVPGTFFIVGDQAKKRPDLIQRIVKDGHALGNHTYNHVYRELYGDFKTFWEQVEKTEAVLQDIAGVRTGLLRAPGGTYSNFDPFYFYFLRQAGYTVYDWNVDSGDSMRKGVPASEIVRNVQHSKRYPATVVLLHDGSGHGETVKALPEIIRYYREQGYAFAALTPGVKPVVFNGSPPKWNRSETTWEKFAEQLTAVQHGQGYATAEETRTAEAPMAYQGQVAVTEAAYALESRQRLPNLTLHVSGKSVVLQERDYRLEETLLFVPLRLLAESIGGRVAWHGDRRTASVDYGPIRLEYRFADMSLVVYQFGHEKIRIHLPDMELRDGSVIVPLRATIGLLGGRLAEVRLDEHERGVVIRGKLPFYHV